MHKHENPTFFFELGAILALRADTRWFSSFGDSLLLFGQNMLNRDWFIYIYLDETFTLQL
jgi:hypothetical protein